MVDFKMRVREGNRGGRELFKWDSVKEDSFKDREQYLGVSTRVGLMGKFGRYIVHDWYINERQKTESIDKEIKDVQAFEEELMQEALGLKPKNLILRKKEWDDKSFEEFKKYDEAKKKAGDDGGTRDALGKVGGGRDELEGHLTAEFASTEEVKGLGFAPHRTAKLEAFKVETLGVKGELAGVNMHIKSKQELDMDARMKYCGSSSSTGSSSSKLEPVIKRELKDDHDEAEGASSSAGGAGMKREVKEEQDESHPEAKIKLEKMDKKDKKKDKKDKKDKKKAKKMKKKAKELKRVAKEIAKLKKKRKRGADDSESSSSSSSS